MPEIGIITRSFGIIMKPMNFFGLYPPDKPSLLYTMRSYLLYIFLMVLVVILLLLNFIFGENKDTLQLNYMHIYATEIGFAALKLLPFVLKGEKLKKCINYFGDQRFKPRTEEEKKITEECVKVCRIICKVYSYGVYVVAILWLIPTWLSKEPKLNLDVWLPYDAFSDKKIFYPTLIFLSIANTYQGVSSVLVDPLLGNLSYHAISQLKILKYNLENLPKFVDNKTFINEQDFSVIDFESAYEILRRCIDHHNDILNFLKEFENCFSWFVFCQIAGSTLALCFCCLGFSMISSSIDALRSLTFYILLLFQLFFYFFFGTLLHEENNGLMDSICNGPWYKYDPRIRKILILMMERSKSPLNIRAGKVVYLSLQTFTAILKTSYSLVTLLKSFE